MKIEDPISELHSTRLYMRLVELDSEYAEKATIFLQNIAPVLATTIQLRAAVQKSATVAAA